MSLDPTSLKNTSISSFDIFIEREIPMHAVIITDIHIGQYYKKSESREHFIRNLRSIVETHNATHVFILGDIIHKKFYNVITDWTFVYSALETLGVEIHIIPGNHDRYMNGAVMAFFRGNNVHLHGTELMRIIPAWDEKLMVCMGHDLKNDKKVHAKNETRIWYSTLRSTFHLFIPDYALLLMGHLHDQTDSKDKLTQSILPFSYDLNSYAYMTLDFENGERTFKRKFMLK